MSDDLLITPGSRKLEIKDTSGNVDAKIETDASGNLLITNAGGDISIGDTSSDVFIGDGTNNVDIVFEQNGEIRGTSGVTLTLGASGSSVAMATDLSLGGNDLTNVGDITVSGNLTVNGTTTTLDSTNTVIEDSIIELNSGLTGANSKDIGFIFERGTTGNNAGFVWDESADRFTVFTTTDTAASDTVDTSSVANFQAGSFFGNGANLTSLNADNLGSGTVPTGRLGNALLKSGGTMTGSIAMANYNITGINQLEINDPGEGIVFKSGSSGDMVLKIIDDSSDNILQYSGTNAVFDVQGNITATGNTTFTGDMNIGNTGNASVRVRHIEGKDSASANLGGLFLNYASTSNVQIGHSGNLNDLFIFGALRTGNSLRLDNSGNLHNIGTVDATYFDSTSTEFTSTRPIKVYHEGGNAATAGGIFLKPHYSGATSLSSFSSAYSSGDLLIGSGMAYKSGASGIVSTFANFSDERSGIRVKRGEIIFTGTTGAVQTTVGDTITVVDTFTHNTTNGDTSITGSLTIPHTLYHAGDSNTYVKFDADRVRIVNGGATYLDTNNGSAVLHTGTTFGGDVSGTYGAIVIADDSHNHVISNVDGLQSALDGKIEGITTNASGGMSGGTTSGTATLSVISLPAEDDRDMKPNTSDIQGSIKAIKPFFSSYGGMTGSANTTWVDVLVLDTYSDSSGGGPNAITFKKGNSAGNPEMHIWHGAWGGTTWSTGQRVFADNYHPNADTLTTARTISLTGAVTGSTSFDGSGNVSIATTATADPTLTLSGDASGSATFTNLGNATLSVTISNDSHTHAFNNLTGKTSGTGDYSTSGDLVAGRGSGSIAMTINDGYGNSNLTFNHQNGTPDQSGNAARIEVNTDSSSDANMAFEVKSNVTGGAAVSLTSAMTLRDTALDIAQYLRHLGDTDTYLQFTGDRVRIAAGGTVKFDSNNTYLTGITSSDVTTALGYTPYQESTALSASSITASSSITMNGTGDFVMDRTDNGFSFVVSSAQETAGRDVIFQQAGGGEVTGCDMNLNFTNISIPDKIYHTGDGNTYMQFNNADQWRVVTGGTERLQVTSGETCINDGSHDYNFRVESNNNTGMLFVDGGTDQVAIGTSTAADMDARFTVQGATIGNTSGDTVLHTTIAGSRHHLDIEEERTASTSDWQNTTYRLGMRVDTTDHQAIEFVSDGSSNEHIDIRAGNRVFNTRFQHDGRVIIGSTTPLGNALFTVDASSSYSAIAVLDSAATNGGYLQLRGNNSAKGTLGFGTNSGATGINDIILSSSAGNVEIQALTLSREIIFATGGTENIKVTGNGNLKFLSQTSTQDTPGITYHTNNHLYVKGGSAGLILSDDGGQNTVQISDSGDYVRVETGDGTERVRINSSGLDIKSGGLLIAGTERINSSRELIGYENRAVMNGSDSGSYYGNMPQTGSGSGSAFIKFIQQNFTGIPGSIKFYVSPANTNVAESDTYLKFLMEHDGDFHADGDVIAYSTSTGSDRKLKENIRDLEGSLDKTLKLRGVKYDWKDENKANDQLGFIAQEVEEVLPEVVKEVKTLTNEGETHLTVNYPAVVPLLVEAIKEQQTIINRLEERLNNLEKGEE